MRIELFQVEWWMVYGTFFGLCALMSLFCAATDKSNENATKDGMAGVMLCIVLFILTSAVFFLDQMFPIDMFLK